MVTKKSTVFFVFLLCLVGSWLFYLKYSVISIEDRIRRAKKTIVEEQRNQHILQAEWKSLTSPERVQRLTMRYLNMRQISPSQLKEFDPSIFHSETSKYKRTKRLSKLVDEILAQGQDNGSI
jgi:cell division protein FtsL